MSRERQIKAEGLGVKRIPKRERIGRLGILSLAPALPKGAPPSVLRRDYIGGGRDGTKRGGGWAGVGGCSVT